MDVDEDLVEDVALRSIEDMGAENQRRCAAFAHDADAALCSALTVC